MTPWMRPAPRSASWLNAAGEKSRSPNAQPAHLSTTSTVTDLPWTEQKHLVQRTGRSDRMGLQLAVKERPHTPGLLSKNPAETATTKSPGPLLKPQAPRPGGKKVPIKV